MIRILIAEDQGMVRGALAALLAFEPDLEVVAEVASGDEVLAAAREARPDEGCRATRSSRLFDPVRTIPGTKWWTRNPPTSKAA